MDEAATKQLFRRKSSEAAFLHLRNKINFRYADEPNVSVIVVMHNEIFLTLNTLASLRANYCGDIQLILVDSGSTDITIVERAVIGAQIIRHEDNISYVRAVNAALKMVVSDYTLLINNDIELEHGALAAAMRRMQSNENIGAVGAKIVRTNGRLQEAGSIIYNDGYCAGYMRDGSQNTPETNFVREVDFCSAAFLLLRTSIFKRLGGFDLRFAPAYYEDADICLRMWHIGFHVIYDPAVVIRHFEFGTSSAFGAKDLMMSNNRRIFYNKHKATLRYQRHRSNNTEIARFHRLPSRRILVIEDHVPLRHLGAGHTRTNDIIRAMNQLGYAITIYPMIEMDYFMTDLYGEFPDNVEIIADGNVDKLPSFLERRAAYYEKIWICRTHNLDKSIDCIVDSTAKNHSVDIILDTEAISSVRLHQQHINNGIISSTTLLDDISRELGKASSCRKIVAVSSNEAALIEACGFGAPLVVGHIRDLALTPSKWSERSDILFVGSFHGADTPNYESVKWLCEDVLPILLRYIGSDAHITIVGYIAPGIDLEYLRICRGVQLFGYVDKLWDVYNAHRVFVAPTRIAAGIPYKVFEAASFGVPTVVSNVLNDQLGWKAGSETLAASPFDPDEFARAIARVYNDEAVWNSIRDGAAQWLEAHADRRNYQSEIDKIFNSDS
ncbi:hypothetical protein A1351_22860 [Methylosinus sp. R-45379]|nr:hypothetical protein A1351_22860 [Methylosinus sp. R-45379]